MEGAGDVRDGRKSWWRAGGDGEFWGFLRLERGSEGTLGSPEEEEVETRRRRRRGKRRRDNLSRRSILYFDNGVRGGGIPFSVI